MFKLCVLFLNIYIFFVFPVTLYLLLPRNVNIHMLIYRKISFLIKKQRLIK